ncbi:hypothetical protein BX611_0406 [Lutibacter oceani]|uniref:Uncharacterized protein n=1 Tax=Lutibacter oceani TaxID=1853311 RepID=A0A3D9S1C3_9FLAO|nr:hypothetical protein [Lutibacter oceani]REE83126.1 hypothetical protein BX611_0406 [Lutibacter oceani]
MENRKHNRGSWVIGGMTILGLGIGFIFLQSSPLLFVASLLIGLGAGIVMASLMV